MDSLIFSLHHSSPLIPSSSISLRSPACSASLSPPSSNFSFFTHRLGFTPVSRRLMAAPPPASDSKTATTNGGGGHGLFKPKIVNGDYGYVLEDVPHLTDYLPHLPTHSNPLQDNPAYSVVKQYFVDVDDTVPQRIVVHKDSPRGTHFRRAGPRQKVYFDSDEVNACIVTCGGLCPGLNTVIREIVSTLYSMYGVKKVLGIDGGYRGFYARNTINLTPKVVNDIHKRGGTILGTSRGGHDTKKIVDSIEDRGINQEVRRRGLKVAVAGIPKTIDNDIPVIDKSFGFDTAVEEAQRAINAAHVEAESAENGIGLVKLMGRYSGFIAMYATLASRDVDCCLIPESPFYLKGEGGLFEFVEKRLKESGHMVIVVAEGAGQELLSESKSMTDASGNKLLQDVGLWLSQNIKVCPLPTLFLSFSSNSKTVFAGSYESTEDVHKSQIYRFDFMQTSVFSCVHGAMAGYTGFTSGLRIIEKQNKVIITDRMWARLLSSTNQPSFMCPKLVAEKKKEMQTKMEAQPSGQLMDDGNTGADKKAANKEVRA
ncbi:unnamed protein product [Linum tenue]|uniref:Phosphofructokinase domain-containing protein n=1 Tax=Linum tenue TaxID=586396 RepID=A0AAV0KUN5_9ROSI|nr:unnamed protein product [Linum tenue]